MIKELMKSLVMMLR